MNTAIQKLTECVEKHTLDSLVVSLHDSRARVLWVSADPANDRELIGRSSLDLISPTDRGLMEDAIHACIFHGRRIHLVVRAADPFVDDHPEELLWRVALIPADAKKTGMPSLAFCIEASRLPSGYDQISDDDKVLLRLLCADHTLKDIAGIMLLSESAIDSKIKKLKAKMGVKNIGGLVFAAATQAIV